MAKTNNNDKPLATLTNEAKKHIDEMGAELDRATGDLDALDELGIDTTRLRHQVDWGKKAREVILKRLT